VKEGVIKLTDREQLLTLGYEKELLDTMTDEDCEYELVELQTGGN